MLEIQTYYHVAWTRDHDTLEAKHALGKTRITSKQLEDTLEWHTKACLRLVRKLGLDPKRSELECKPVGSGYIFSFCNLIDPNDK